MTVLSTEERAIIDTVRQFVDRQVRPVAQELDHANEYPGELIEQMKRAVYSVLRFQSRGARHRCLCLATRCSPLNWPGAG